MLGQLAEPRYNFSSSLFIFANFDNMLYQTRSPCLHAGSLVPLFLRCAANPPPSPRYSTRGKNDRVQACWQCEDSSALYIWKSHQLSLVSLSAALLPSHHQTSGFFFSLLFHPLLLSFLLTLAYLSHSQQLCGVTDDWGTTPHLMLQTQYKNGNR